jgi:WD40 repeat protein
MTPDAPPTQPKPRRWPRIRYSLRTLLLFTLFIGSCPLLYLHYDPWHIEFVLQGNARYIRMANFSHDGQKILTADCIPAVYIWEADTGKQLMSIQEAGGGDFSPDGSCVLTCNNGLRLNDVHSGHVLRELTNSAISMSRACFSPDGHLIVAAGWDGITSTHHGSPLSSTWVAAF